MRVARLLVGTLLFAMALGIGAVAHADNPDYTAVGPQVEGTNVVTPPAQVAPAAVQAATEVRAQTQTRGQAFGVTGGDIAGLTFVGLGAIAVGLVLVRRRRPARA